MTRREVSLTIPDDAWRDAAYDSDAPPGHRLKTTLVVNGTALNLEAHLVVPEADPQRTYAGDDDIALVHHATGGDGPWHTTLIRGRRYVLVATPFCD